MTPDKWLQCDNPAELLNMASALVDARLVIQATCDCARTTLSDKDEARLKEVEAIEGWVRGEVGLEEVYRAREESLKADQNRLKANSIGVSPYGHFVGTDAMAEAIVSDEYDAALKAAKAEVAKVQKESNEKMCAIIRKRIPLELVQKGLAKS